MSRREYLLSEIERKMSLSDWHYRLTQEEADLLRVLWLPFMYFVRDSSP